MNNNGNNRMGMRPRKFEPPNSHAVEAGPRMMLTKPQGPGFLRPGLHRVLTEVEPGKWQIVGDTGQDLPLLQIELGAQHAIGLQQANMMIIDADNKPVTKFENYRPAPQPPGQPITPENQRIRDRWVASIINWLLPEDIRAAPNTPENRQNVQQALADARVSLSISPDGTAAIIEREGGTLAAWYC